MIFDIYKRIYFLKILIKGILISRKLTLDIRYRIRHCMYHLFYPSSCSSYYNVVLIKNSIELSYYIYYVLIYVMWLDLLKNLISLEYCVF